ncbi:MAG: threonine synthase [Prolixibacteraceae bacterium]|nr:threonine synthase [Prolixibacteraceae bacterium]
MFVKYYSTRHSVPEADLKYAVSKGLAADNGLFMPGRIDTFDPSFFQTIDRLSFQEISFQVALKFFGDDIDHDKLKEIVFDTLSFDCPVVHVQNNIYALELFHGPTLAFKDVGARFMARLLAHFLEGSDSLVNVLVATSGDTGSAVANGFLGVPGIHVYVLYPKGKVSAIQECQFTTLGQNITALEIDGNFDDCQRLVKTAFLDKGLNEKLTLTSANSINVARFLPQAFYYFSAYARMEQRNKEFIVSVPSGNFGNLTAGLVAKRMGLPVNRFIAANNENDIVYHYLKTGMYNPAPSVQTLANAMDVGDPSNFVRILDLYGNSHEAISADIAGFRYSDDEIRSVIDKVYKQSGYLLDPHGACGYQSLEDYLNDDQVGIFLETAHPAKFTETVESIVGKGNIALPAKLAEFMKGTKQSIPLGKQFETFRGFLLSEV